MKSLLSFCSFSLLLLLLTERVSSFCCPRRSSGIAKPSSSLHRRVAADRLVTFTLQYRSSNSIAIPTKLYSSTTFSLGSSNIDSNEQPLSTRSKLRQLTGFSLTAFRATIRGITGISLSGVLSNTIKSILDIFRPGMRWVIQPLLILYYVPILFVRYYFIGPSEQYVNDSRRGHEKLVDGWRKAVEIAERAHADGYWPVHLNGEILFRCVEVQEVMNVSLIHHNHSIFSSLRFFFQMMVPLLLSYHLIQQTYWM